MDDCSHAHHRERLRQQFLRNGLDSFTDYQKLELLLFYSIPRQDTNPLAHRLLDAFGSLAGVFNASYEDLCRVPGISHNTATFLKLQRQMFQEYYKSFFEKPTQLLSTEDSKRYVVPRFVAMQDENFLLVCLDSACRVLYAGFISEGDPVTVSISPRKIFATALSHNAVAVLLAHNHPHQYASPSLDDVETTRQLIHMLAPAGIEVLDHLIVPGIPTTKDSDLNKAFLDCVSMRDSREYGHLFGKRNSVWLSHR